MTDLRRYARSEEFSLDYYNTANSMPTSLLDQFDRCRSDEARRLILGISSKDSLPRNQSRGFRAS